MQTEFDKALAKAMAAVDAKFGPAIKLQRPMAVRECECGAKHTSNPKHHLGYCPLNNKGDK
jgi:hypothetical protein